MCTEAYEERNCDVILDKAFESLAEAALVLNERFVHEIMFELQLSLIPDLRNLECGSAFPVAVHAKSVPGNALTGTNIMLRTEPNSSSCGSIIQYRQSRVMGTFYIEFLS